MKLLLLFTLLQSALIGQLTQNITDAVTSEYHYLAPYWNGSRHSGTPEGADNIVISEAQLDYFKSHFLENGSWDDIDYENQSQTVWRALYHCYRILDLAKFWKVTGNEEAKEMALRATEWWVNCTPFCSTNTFNNDIGAPKALSTAFLLLKDAMSPELKDKAIKALSTSTLKGPGCNKIWLAGCILQRALIAEDETLVKLCRDVICSEFRISANQGVQADWQYHQHGHFVQTAMYGMGFAVCMLFWTKVFDGTPLAFPEEKVDILKGFIGNALAPAVWNGYSDNVILGRSCNKNSAKSIAGRIERLCKLWQERTGEDLRAGSKPLAIYYKNSDWGIYRTAGWYSSIRMESNRIIGFESINSQNLKGYFTPDGNLCVRRDGDEYTTIGAMWEGHRIPGVTSYDDGKPLYRYNDHKPPFNKSGKVFGRVEGQYMITGMELDRDGLSARKAWFFFPDGIVCLGAGISKNSDQVLTTVQNCKLKGSIEKGKGWVRHNGVTYVPLDGQKYFAADTLLTGNWRWMWPESPDKSVYEHYFQMVLDHGTAPKDKNYCYVVLPGGESGNDAYKKALKIKILSNTKDKQSVRINGRTFTVDWNKVEEPQLPAAQVKNTAEQKAPEAVDLGLSVKWADVNAGAAGPEETGSHLKYKEIGGKYRDGFRLPTAREQKELVEKCGWEWTSEGGANGYKVTGPSGKSIFLPAAGYTAKGDLSGDGDLGYYMSCTPGFLPDPRLAPAQSAIIFGSGAVTVADTTPNYGLSVRYVQQ